MTMVKVREFLRRNADVALGTAVLVLLLGLFMMTLRDGRQEVLLPDGQDRAVWMPLDDRPHLTDWSGLMGGATPDAKKVKVIAVHPLMNGAVK
jgi:hypothetical protein